jgi:hypothetical protein
MGKKPVAPAAPGQCYRASPESGQDVLFGSGANVAIEIRHSEVTDGAGNDPDPHGGIGKPILNLGFGSASVLELVPGNGGYLLAPPYGHHGPPAP